ncbi:MAG: hypothetical protein JO242_16325 [Streptosporangiaceae bacterium]|nr:hypothetical protein [Streptosporangiaceae bacterium]
MPGPAQRPKIPDPRRLLALLSPEARFVVVGWQTVGGIRLGHLRATRASGLPSRAWSWLRVGPPGESPSALYLWADARGWYTGSPLALRYQRYTEGHAHPDAGVAAHVHVRRGPGIGPCPAEPRALLPFAVSVLGPRRVQR